MSEEREKQSKPSDTEDIDISSIEIRSEEVQEIMGYIPHWIIRSGISMFFAVIMLFLVGSWFFKYPDVIAATITVTTETPPAAIVARSSGKIQRLFVTDGQKLNAGESIAILENATNYNHLLQLREKLDALAPLSPHYDFTGAVQFDENYSLGELQSIYTMFLKSYFDYRAYILLDYNNKKIQSTREEIAQQKLLIVSTKSQVVNMEKQLEVSRAEYDRSAALFKDGVISEDEMGRARSLILQKENALEAAHSSLKSQDIQLGRLEQSILDLELRDREQRKQLELTLNGAYDNLVGRIAQWEQSYVLKTPISGTISFTKFWSTNQNVNMGETVVTVIPDNAGDKVGKVILPVLGSGKVEVGQLVNIKFFNYPHVEFGMVRGVVKSKSLVASDNNYVVEVTLPNGLKTSYGEVLPFNQEMQGTAEIITEDVRLLERIFKPIKSILKRM